jgi:hypothetical protein
LGWVTLKVDEEKYRLQQAYMQSLREMKVRELRGLHKRTFEALPAQFSHAIPYWCNRLVFERRLFLVFAAKNYHLPRGTRHRAEFLKQVRKVLLNNFDEFTEQIDKQLAKEIKKNRNFSKERVKSLDIKTVDKYLAQLGIELKGEVQTAMRRRVLWEYFNLPAKRMRIRKDEKFMVRRLHKKDSLRLEQIVLKYPSIDWPTFVHHFADELPMVDNAQFREKKAYLRKKGYEIPKLDHNGRTPEQRKKHLAKLRRKRYEQRKKAKKLNRNRGFKGEVTIRLSAIFPTGEAANARDES